MALIAVYGPTSDSQQCYQEFLDYLAQSIVLTRQLGLQVIVAGDFNCHDSRFPPYRDNPKGVMNKQLMEDLGLSCMDKTDQYTF